MAGVYHQRGSVGMYRLEFVFSICTSGYRYQPSNATKLISIPNLPNLCAGNREGP